MFCCMLLFVRSSIAIILMGKRELVALLKLSSWCLMIAVWPCFAVPQGYLRFVIVVFPDHTHLLFFSVKSKEVRALRGYFSPPIRLKNKNCFSPFCSHVFIRTNAKV